MAETPRPLVAGNWKMNGLRGSAAELTKIMSGARRGRGTDRPDGLPASDAARDLRALAQGTPVTVGAQDCHAEASGAFTGDLSAEMLRDAGAVAVIVGHSERRMYHRETDAEVNAKARAAWRAGLMAIVCVGETKDERDGGKTLDVVHVQTQTLAAGWRDRGNLVVAYEPVWAIGTGLTPTPADVAAVHGFIRAASRDALRRGRQADPHPLWRLGQASNAAELMQVPNVDGALVGGASLKADDFLGIARAYL